MVLLLAWQLVPDPDEPSDDAPTADSRLAHAGDNPWALDKPARSGAPVAH